MEECRGGVGSSRERPEAWGKSPGPALDRPLPVPEANCSIIWAVFSGADINDLLLLVERRNPPARKRSLVVGYNLGNWSTVGTEQEGAGSQVVDCVPAGICRARQAWEGNTAQGTP